MLRTVLVSAVALSMVAGAAAFAQDAGTEAPAASERTERGPGRFFGRMDADANGSITSEELGGERLELLRQADANNDGTLTEEELVTYVMNREFRRQAQRTAQRLDIDGNGTVTLAEIEDHQNKRFALLDRNNDNQLSQDELRRGGFGKRMHMRGGDHDGERFAMRRGDGRHHKFMHRMERATPAQNAPANE